VTEEQGAKIDALGRCTFIPGSGPKRFVHDVIRTFARLPEREPSPKQVDYLDFLCYHFREQLSGWVPSDKLEQWIAAGKRTRYYREREARP
jgi:hypothetical protein